MCRTVGPPSIISDYGAQRKPSMFGFGPRRNTRPAGRVPRDVYSFCILWGLGVSSIGRTSTPNRVARQTGSSMALLVEQLQSSVRICRWYCNRPMTPRNADLSMRFDRVSLTVSLDRFAAGRSIYSHCRGGTAKDGGGWLSCYASPRPSPYKDFSSMSTLSVLQSSNRLWARA
jgi:hypothetical protein